MEYNKIKSALRQRNLTDKKLAELIGMTPNGLRTSMVNHTMTIKTLEKICEILEVPMTYFFDDSDGKIPPPKGVNEKDLAKCKQQVIELQAEVISLLKSREKP